MSADNYGNYTTYHFDDGADEMSDFESLGTPPPPPPSRPPPPAAGPADEENPPPPATDSPDSKMNQTTLTEQEEYDFAEDNSVEIPPTKVVEDYQRREIENGKSAGKLRLLLAACLCCLLLSLAVVMGVGFGMGAFERSSTSNAAVGGDNGDSTGTDDFTSTDDVNKDDDDTYANYEDKVTPIPEVTRDPTTPPPTDSADKVRAQSIRDYFGTITLKQGTAADAVTDLSTPEGLAVQWLIVEDPLQLDPTVDPLRLQQRYALVTLWYNSEFMWVNETNWLNDNECDWYGVTCSDYVTADGNSLQVVDAINLESNNVQGVIPDDLALLPFLITLNLADNLLEGSLPTSLTQLSELQNLFLDRNLLTGDLSSYPFSIDSSWPDTMVMLDLSFNRGLTGSLSDSLFDLVSLQVLVLDYCSFTGTLSNRINNLSSLTRFTAGDNQFSGDLPREWFDLDNLQVLWLFKNEFSGELPPQMSEMDGLLVLDLFRNSLSGDIPNALPRALWQLNLGANQLTGNLPPGLENLVNLTDLNVERNALTGEIPDFVFADMESMETLVLANNDFAEGPIPQAISNMPFLRTLKLQGCNRVGFLQDMFGNDSNMTWPERLEVLDVSRNTLEGFIPNELADTLFRLQELSLDNNFLTGEIPPNFAELQRLVRLDLHDNLMDGPVRNSFLNMGSLEYADLSINQFSGFLPDNLGALEFMQELRLNDNVFSGEIPESIGNMVNMIIMDLSNNNFVGPLPDSVTNMVELVYLSVHNNFLSGPIPENLGALNQMRQLHLHTNAHEEDPSVGFSGPIPTSLGLMTELTTLYLYVNQLTGDLPSELGNLVALERFDVEYNALTGELPAELSNLSVLGEFYVSHNDISGVVPQDMCFIESLEFFVTDCDVVCPCCSLCVDETEE